MTNDFEPPIVQLRGAPESNTSSTDVTPKVAQSVPARSPDGPAQNTGNSGNGTPVDDIESQLASGEELPRNPKQEVVSESDTLLYCRKNGFSHANLVYFGVEKCPRCQEDLLAKPRLVNKDKLGNEKALPDGSGEVAFALEYEDSGGNLFGRENLTGPFDLQEARKGVVIQDQNAILRVVSVLRTSHPATDNRYSDGQKLLTDRAVLKDPAISISIHSTKLVVYSEQFLKVLRQFVQYYPNISLQAQSVTLAEPFCVIAHHLQELRDFQEAHRPQGEAARSTDAKVQDVKTKAEIDDELTYRHIDTVMSFVEKLRWEENIEMEKARWSQEPPMCTYQMLWLLYKPGDTLYTESDGKPTASVIQSVRVDPAVLRLQPDKLRPYRITIWYLDFDGRYVRRWSRVIVVAPFDGEKEISTLSAVPCSIFDKFDSGQRRQTLESEGEHWFRLLGPRQVRYSGNTMDQRRRRVDGRVMIDCDTYWQKNPPKKQDIIRDYYSKEQQQKAEEELEKEPRLTEDVGVGSAACPCQHCLGLRTHPPLNFIWIDYDLIDPTRVESLYLPGGPRGDKHRYLLCSRRLMGYVLKSRNWEILDVACCNDLAPNTKAIEKLVMPQDNKEIINALVHSYATDPSKSSPDPWGTDFIEDKGYGKLFLLHGSPGVGKTYTAECIAEYTRRPLLSLTCGDLGNDETQVEKALSKWFDLAERWGAVMLLDEADVYTEKRLLADLKRNSMVSVFLRCMEYYKGILFLTTNRVGTFDDAFISRIHIIIHYKDLTPEYRNVIWGQFFDKLEDERDDIEIRRNCRSYVMDDMAGIQCNGREIRNTFQTAVALAYYEFSQKENKKPNEVAVLTSKHFEKVCRITLQFKDYLKDVNNGLDENQRAAMVGSRASDGEEIKIP